ncbi:Zn-ribbon domain-containing OB-fold protein [Salinirubrum litoreum]|uniref:Zn-ribbon domain-containing OB-fold protein n=1 Tax=Salinirubrum litoreum TaxID=1126234 RepID=A0ABD5R8L9_9EURY|nr:OB-fold domain-containing protein [Salinirubrum litoreum]
MTDETTETNAETDDAPIMEAARYADGSITYPPHPLGPDGGDQVGTVDLSEYTAEVVTWTTSTATPPGVRQPNTLAIVEFDVDGEPVRAIGQATTDAVEIGDEVRPVYCSELRDPEAGIREPASQDWDGFRFDPVSDGD